MEDMGGAIIVGHFPLTSGEWIPPHSHTHHQLAWTRRGVLSVEVGEVYWVLPPTRALWLPAGVTHATGATRDAVLCSLYLAPERCPLDCPEPTAVGVDGLLAELIAYLARTDLADDARLRAALPLLAEGQPVSRVAHSVGYATASAFLAAFRRTVGTTPRRYLLSR
ncbi:helix-turn-helix domain-containing protein [Nonomuraea sp. NPDC051941]|uniref:helix-turn-helix domain-containing protein n=1 Tax=Nonomuraea sp. NPDC051941 TaxID=3364373 RepID=UPI0037C98C72